MRNIVCLNSIGFILYTLVCLADTKALCSLQVNATLKAAAIVVIQVSAYALFTDQPYSLAVLGDFTGTLASSNNPAYTGTQANCSQLVPKIISGPGRYTSNVQPVFSFKADSGAGNSEAAADMLTIFTLAKIHYHELQHMS